MDLWTQYKNERAKKAQIYEDIILMSSLQENNQVSFQFLHVEAHKKSLVFVKETHSYWECGLWTKFDPSSNLGHLFGYKKKPLSVKMHIFSHFSHKSCHSSFHGELESHLDLHHHPHYSIAREKA